MSVHDIDDLPLTISWFDTAFPKGPAIGDPERTTWGGFCGVFWWRREGEKDGPNFIPAAFASEPDGRHVRRLKRNLISRTAIALDIETNKETGEVPPSFAEATLRIGKSTFAAVVYTSHNHTGEAPRYRIVLPIFEEIAVDLPVAEVMAETLDLAGVLDMSKTGASSLFYLPSCPYDALDLHQTAVVPGGPVGAGWMRNRAGAILAARQAEADRTAAEAHAEAAARREAKIEAGLDPENSLIERLRLRFDLGAVLLAHGYDKVGTKYRHPNSQSGSFGADIKIFGGIERVFSHNGTDPLHATNLPAWCGGVTALDAFDVVTILEFGGHRTRALRDLAERLNLSKAREKKAVAGLIFRMIRRQAGQEEIERAALAEGKKLGLSHDQVCQIAAWVASQATASSEAA